MTDGLIKALYLNKFVAFRDALRVKAIPTHALNSR